jgi:MFS family permease
MTAFVLDGLAGQWPIGWLSDRLDRRGVLLASTLALLGLCGAFALGGEGAGGLRLALAFGFGALAFAMYPLCVAHTLDRLGADLALPAAGQLLLASSLGAVAGPVVAAHCMERFGPGALFVADAAVLGLFALVAAVRILRVEAAPQEAFRPVPRTSVVALELDERTHAGESPDAGAPSRPSAVPGASLAEASRPGSRR